MKLTLDASVHLGALNPHESDSDVCQELLALLYGEDRASPPDPPRGGRAQGAERVEVFSPTLLIVELSASVARAYGDPTKAAAVYEVLRALPSQTMIPLSELLAEETSRLAAQHGLSDSEAVYGAVAQLYGTTLVTLDAAQRQGLAPVIGVWHPAEALRQLSADASS